MPPPAALTILKCSEDPVMGHLSSALSRYTIRSHQHDLSAGASHANSTLCLYNPLREPSAMTEQEQSVQARLEELGIVYTRNEHPPVATVEEASAHWAGIDATHCKNLFLRNQKGNRHYLVVLTASKKADLKAVADQIGDGKLSFASPERLMTHLGLTPGSVSPFGLINDREHSVKVVLDRDFQASPRLAFHPNINTATLTVTAADFAKFLAACGNAVQHVSI